MKKFYQIGSICIEVEIPEMMQIPKNMKLFEIPEKDIDQKENWRYYRMEIVDTFPNVEETFIQGHSDIKVIEHPDLKILYTKNQECRLIRFPRDEEPYAIYLNGETETTHVWVHRKVLDMLFYDTIFLSMFGLEKEMLRDASMILHSAYIVKDGKAILFSAPSETGKSTQASLWEKYRGAKIVNGDRSLLKCDDGIWYAHGWPICGSSEICHNESYPIQAIVMLYQSKENVVRRLGGAEAVKKVFSQIMVNMWNKDNVVTALDLVQQLAMHVPVFELGCTISEEAVECLERILK